MILSNENQELLRVILDKQLQSLSELEELSQTNYWRFMSLYL